MGLGLGLVRVRELLGRAVSVAHAVCTVDSQGLRLGLDKLGLGLRSARVSPPACRVQTWSLPGAPGSAPRIGSRVGLRVTLRAETRVRATVREIVID